MTGALDQRYLPILFDSSPLGIFTVDSENRITSFNRAAEEITHYTSEEAIGQRCYDIFHANICQQDCPLKRSVRTRKKIGEREISILNKAGDEIPIAVSTAALLDSQGQVLGGVEMFRDLSQLAELRKRLHKSYEFEDIISKNEQMQRILERLPLLAASPSTILIEGASGTGKELVAQAIHNLSPRRKNSFIAVNCAALPDSLLESELFGYVRGAFSEAKQDKPGRFMLANGGTLFLDEIGDISPAMQVKLLRVLQQREFEPLGATHTQKVDVRVIVATNKNLETEMKEKRFREDLYFRLNVIRVELPPLSQRREDIPLLLDHFIRRFNAIQGSRIKQVSSRAMQALMAAPYPGNIRELENAVEHASVLCQGDTLRLMHLPSSFETHVRTAQPESSPLDHENSSNSPLQAAEAQTIQTVLDRCHGNRGQAAKELGISRNTLWRKMKRFGLL